MGIFDNMKKMFGPRNPLNNMKPEELQKEKIRLDLLKRQLNNKADVVERDQQNKFQELVKEKSAVRQRDLAADIDTLDKQLKGLSSNMGLLAKAQQAVNALIFLKENETTLTQTGLNKYLQGLDKQEVGNYVRNVSVESQDTMNKLNDLVETIDEAHSLPSASMSSNSIAEILRQAEMARETEADPNAIEAHFTEMKSKLKAADKEQN